MAGARLIARTLALAEAVRPKRIVVNLHYLPEVLDAHLKDRAITTIREEPDILDTGGGLRNALPALDSDPVVTVNSDAIWAGPNPISFALAAWDPEKMAALLVCVPMTRVHGRVGGGDFVLDDQGRLHRGSDLVYGGVQIMKTARLHDVPGIAFSLNAVWNEMAQDGRLYGVGYPGHWADVGHPEGIAIAEDMLRHHDV